MPTPLIECLTLAARAGERRVLRTVQQDWTGADLLDDASEITRALQEVGVAPRTFVLLAMNRGAEFVLSLCAIHLAGAIPVVADPTDALVWERVLAELRPSAILLAAAAPLADLPALGRLRRRRDVRHVSRGHRAVECIPCRRPRRFAPAVSHVLFTSGTTAGIKGVVWSDGRVVHNLANCLPVGCRPGGDGVSGLLVPLSTALGFHELLRALWTGATCVLIDEPIPAAFEAMRDLGVTGFQCTPTHAELMLASAAPLPPALRRINVTSAPIAADRLLALLRRVQPTFLSKSYGLTEVGPVCVLGTQAIRAKADTVGRPIQDHRLTVTVRDERGRVLAPQTEGDIVVEAGVWHEPDGYLTDDPELRKRFAGGVLWTGDRGLFDADGYLVLRSRASEILKVAGRGISATKIEAALRPLLGGADVAVVGVSHPRLGQVPAAVYVPAGAIAAPSAESLARALRPDEVPRWMLARRSLPLTQSGKIRRGLLAKEAQAWASFWKHRLVVGEVLWPARRIARLAAGEVFLVDGCPPSWRRRLRARERNAAARIITLARRADALEPLGVAFLQDGAARASAGIRMVTVRPFPARSFPPPALLQLVQLARRLPGPPAKAVVVERRGKGARLEWISRRAARASRRRGAALLSSLVRELAAQLCRT